jgi:hypothetical protein
VNNGSDVVLNCGGGALIGLMVQSKQFGGICSVDGNLKLEVVGYIYEGCSAFTAIDMYVGKFGVFDQTDKGNGNVSDCPEDVEGSAATIS